MNACSEFAPFSSPGLVAYVDLDERAIDALREFNEEGALTVLQQFKESDLSHVQVSVCKSHPVVEKVCLPACSKLSSSSVSRRIKVLSSAA